MKFILAFANLCVLACTLSACVVEEPRGGYRERVVVDERPERPGGWSCHYHERC